MFIMNRIFNLLFVLIFCSLTFCITAQNYKDDFFKVQILKCRISNTEFFHKLDSIVDETTLKQARFLKLCFMKHVCDSLYLNDTVPIPTYRTMCETDFNLSKPHIIFISGDMAILTGDSGSLLVESAKYSYILPKECLESNLVKPVSRQILVFDRNKWKKELFNRRTWSALHPERYVLCQHIDQFKLLPKDCYQYNIFIGISECEEDSTAHQSKP